MSDIKYTDIIADGSDWLVSLKKLTGKNVVDLHGYLSSELGGVVITLNCVVFEDGTEMGIDGEHDFPYLCDYRTMPQPNFDDETLERLEREQDENDD